MNVIFLDCDGVINHRGCDFKYNTHPVDPACAARVVRIAEEGSAFIVMSSSWRHAENWRDLPVGIRRSLLIGRTGRRANRGEEITDWLDEHPVHAYVVLDDDTFDLGRHAVYTVQTSMLTGLRDDHVQRALTILARGVA